MLGMQMSCKTQQIGPILRFLNYGVRSTVGLVIVVIACAPTTQPQPQTASAKAPGSSTADINNALATVAMNASLQKADYQIGSEDLLQITVFNIPDVGGRDVGGRVGPGTGVGVSPRTVSVRVSHEGLISLPLIGDIKVAALTPSGLERELKRQYDKYIYNPQVSVLVMEYRQRVSVIGAVSKPGVIELTGPKTVIEMVAMAGGVTEQAGTQVHIYRQGPNGRESHVIDLVVLASNASLITADNAGLITMPVQPGDIINVPIAGMFFVDGAVKAPGSYPLGRRYSLSQALTKAGGLDRDMYSSAITIFRRGPSGIEPINVDVNQVLAGSTIDPQIEADDVILVPIHTGKYVYFKIFGQILGWGTSIGGVAASGS
jgi:polysaccharide export outer membrane protein